MKYVQYTKHLPQLFTCEKRKIVLRPGFGPGSPTREAGILDRTILPEHAPKGSLLIINRFCNQSANKKWVRLLLRKQQATQ